MLLLFAHHLFLAQAYQPFPTSDAYWRQYLAGWECYTTDYQYSITGDTTINGLVYHKLRKNGFENNAYFNFPYVGCFRNDIPGKKVYVIFPGQNNDSLLYDFDLELDEYLPISPINPWGEHYVSAIDSVLLGGVYHKRFTIGDCWDPIYLIEGVGSTLGLFEEIYCPFECVNYLTCLSVNGQTIYPEESMTCLPTDLSETSNDKVFSAFPNPFTEVLRIESEQTRGTISIYNAQGRCIMSAAWKGSPESFNLDYFPPGIYVVKLKSSTGALASKVVVKE